MTYPYGTHGAPAVGGGLPGLPRRKHLGSKPDTDAEYSYLVLSDGGSSNSYVANVQKYDIKGLKTHEWYSPNGGGDDNTDLESASLSSDQAVLAFSHGRGLSEGTWVTLLNTKDLSEISSVRVLETADIANRAGVAISSDLGLLAISYGSSNASTVLAIYTISEFISNSGWDISSLTPVYQETVGNYCTSLAWSPNGKLLAVGRGRRSDTSRPTGSVSTLRFWPSMEVFSNIVSESSNSAVKGLMFSPDSRSLVSLRDVTTSSTQFINTINYADDGTPLSQSATNIGGTSGSGSGNTSCLPAVTSRGGRVIVNNRHNLQTNVSVQGYLSTPLQSMILDDYRYVSGPIATQSQCNSLSKDGMRFGHLSSDQMQVINSDIYLGDTVIFQVNAPAKFGFILGGVIE